MPACARISKMCIEQSGGACESRLFGKTRTNAGGPVNVKKPTVNGRLLHRSNHHPKRFVNRITSTVTTHVGFATVMARAFSNREVRQLDSAYQESQNSLLHQFDQSNSFRNHSSVRDILIRPQYSRSSLMRMRMWCSDNRRYQ